MIFASLGDCTELRPLFPRHASELAACVHSARAHLASWTVLAARVTDTESARVLLEEYSDPPRYFGIWRNGMLAGGALFRSISISDSTCEIGGWLIPEAQGHGLITAAFRQLITWATEDQRLDRVELHTSAENDRARAVAERLGMRLSAVHPESCVLNGIRHDSEVWALQSAEWR